MKYLLIIAALLGSEVSPAADEEKQPPLPLGFWSEKEHGLYVFVGDFEEGLIQVGEQGVQIGGPPPRQGKADSILISDEKGASVEGKKIRVSGLFNWDSEDQACTLVITWTEDSITLTIMEGSQSDRFPAGQYLLKKSE